MFERLIYTNSAGRTIEFSTKSSFYVNVSKDVDGLSDVKATIYRDAVVGADGTIETGYQLDERTIDIVGTLRERGNQEELTRELQRVFSPFYTGILRHEGATSREIDVRTEIAPKVTTVLGKRQGEFSLTLIAPNPIWRACASVTRSIVTGGTTIYYEGSRACGIEITITAGANTIDMDSLTVTNGSTVETITFRTGGGISLNTGDVLVVKTTPPAPVITLNDVNALERISFANTVFPKLYPGNNIISWDAHGDEADFTVSVKYTTLYLGK